MKFKGDITAEALAEVLVEKYKLLILPGIFFPSYNDETATTTCSSSTTAAAVVRTSNEQYFRCGLGKENFGAALAVLERAMEELYPIEKDVSLM